VFLSERSVRQQPAKNRDDKRNENHWLNWNPQLPAFFHLAVALKG
jgi:hypothetical protein